MYPYLFFIQDIIDSIKSKGHNVSSYDAGAAACGIYVQPDGIIQANSDFRKFGDGTSGIDPV